MSAKTDTCCCGHAASAHTEPGTFSDMAMCPPTAGREHGEGAYTDRDYEDGA